MKDNSFIYRYSKFSCEILKNKALRSDCLKHCLNWCQTLIETLTLNLQFLQKRAKRQRNSDIDRKLIQFSIQISKTLYVSCHAAFFESPNMIMLKFSLKMRKYSLYVLTLRYYQDFLMVPEKNLTKDFISLFPANIDGFQERYSQNLKIL